MKRSSNRCHYLLPPARFSPSFFCAWLLATSLLCTPHLLHAQEMTLRSTTSLDTLQVNTLYRFPEFTKGVLHYKDGKTAASRFNVNMLVDEVQFINPSGDTLSLSDEQTVDHVSIGEQLFYLNKGVIEVIGGYKPVQLGQNQKMETKSKDPIGAYGESSGTTAVTRLGSLYTNDKAFQLKANENILLSKGVTFFFVRGETNTILAATRNNLFKLLKERDEKALDAYLSANKVNFKKEEDLRKLLAFCDQLKVK